MAISPTFAIFVYTQTHNFQLLFWLAFAVALFGLIVDSTVKVRRGESADAKSAQAAQSAQAARTVSLDRFFLKRGWLVGANMVFFGFCFGVMSNYLAIYGKQVLGITGGTGMWFMLCSVGLILSRLQGGKALREGRLTHNASEGMVISLVGYTLFILLPTVAEAFMSQIQSFKSDNIFVLNYAMLGLAGYPGQRPPVARVPEHDDFDGAPQRARHGQLDHPRLMGRGHGAGRAAGRHHCRAAQLCHGLLVRRRGQRRGRAALLSPYPPLLPSGSRESSGQELEGTKKD